MKRHLWAWLAVAVVPACGADLDLGGPRPDATAGSGAISHGDDAGSGGSMTPDGSGATEGGEGGTTNPIQAGAGATVGGAGSGGSSTTSGGSGSASPVGPYEARSGTFKMLVYSKTAGFRHDSIENGKTLLNTIASEVGIDPPDATEDNSWISQIDDYELVFFLNTTGDVFNANEQQLFEAWMTKGGAFCGTHSATDTENGWAFYSELTGQYYDGHGAANTAGLLQLEAAALNHPALAGLPNPWPRNEEWYRFNSHQIWSAKPGFQILGRFDGQPLIFTREFGNFRSFYTALGHDKTVFQDAEIKNHLKGGIMWSVRREHCLAIPKPAGCP